LGWGVGSGIARRAANPPVRGVGTILAARQRGTIPAPKSPVSIYQAASFLQVY
jgi:hypothetical protein